MTRSWAIQDVAFIGIVSDQSETRRFYQDLLGLELLDETDTYAYLAIDREGRLEILGSGTPTARQQRSDAPAVGFLVDDLDAAVAALQPSGALRSTVQEWRSETATHRWIYLRDPADNVLLLLERRGAEPADGAHIVHR